ncbi:MAG: NADH-quinone oxidoreductase subunit NuoF [Clostridia bacterium]|nr:NADH-quinone oxidoreductase subunit NuoF [Clostridia bacterium]
MNIQQLTEMREVARQKLLVRSGELPKDGYKYHVLVCGGTGCVSSGCKAVRDTLIDEIKNRGLEEKVRVIVTGCLGPCNMGPIVTIYPEGTFYQHVKPDDAVYIVREHLENGRHIEGLMYRSPETGKLQDRWEEIDYFRNQMRLVLRNCGFIDPLSLEEYIARDGYAALAAVLEAGSPEKVIEEITSSGLRGRGGAGFPTGLKWGFVRKAPGTPKYVVCNGDEGDPGAFMDRSVLEGDPHSVLEGMVIGAFAVGASQGYAYIRAEYPLAIKNFSYAIEQARLNGFLGKDILGTGFDFDVEVRVGAGAFVCGEETALLESIMGRRGEPRPRPPFPAQEGLFGKPTTINNVETWANVPLIIHRGGDWYASIGTEKSKGTKVFALAGKVNNTGLVEVPLGTTLRQVIFDIGGGVAGGKQLKAVQTGGPSGGAIPAKYVDVPISYESLAELGSIMGSGGMIVLDEDSCMVDLARFFMDFVQDESCGKCTPCRIGTRRMSEILTKLTQGRGAPEDVELLIELANVVKNSALCGLGQTAPNPVLSTTNNYRDEYDAHVKDRKCPTGVCPMRVAPSRVRK